MNREEITVMVLAFAVLALTVIVCVMALYSVFGKK